MPIVQISFTFPSLNASVQVGDNLYYSTNMHNYGGQETLTVKHTTKLGEIVSIVGNVVSVIFDNSLITPPPNDAFISFSKNKSVNTTDLVGYYAKAKFVNSENNKSTELFSVGSNVSISSK